MEKSMKIKLLNLPEDLKQPLLEVADLLQVNLSEDGIPVTVKQNGSGPKILCADGNVTIEYHKKPEFFRLLTLLPERISEGGVYEENPAHEDLCLMSDCSRNAVYNVPAAKRMIRYLALMGFTSFMLYTEDTYEIPDYPFFGYLRGRFTREELREIDQYACSFGIEVIPCIQVLAHLEGSLRWSTFNEITDVGNILLVGEEKTYALIRSMIQTCRECFSSGRIHLGMDEAHLLGSGKYLDTNGYRPRSEIILEHLDRVVKICEEFQFAPMIWSDMFFRIAFHTYYIDHGEIPSEVIKLVPKNLSLVYWDYYTKPDQEQRFRHMIHCHQQFSNPLIFAGGAWKWGGMAPSNYFSLWVNDMHLKVCKEERVPMVIATTWGDNGAEASNFSVMPTLQQYAEYAYANGADREWVKKRFQQTFGLPFDDFLLLDSPNLLSNTNLCENPRNPAKYLLYNDPLGGWLDDFVSKNYAKEYAEKQRTLQKVPENQFGYMFKTSAALCAVLSLKATLSLEIRSAYKSGHSEALREICDKRIPELLGALENYLITAREEWFYDNKTFGFDVVELRIGGLKERLRSVKLLLAKYLDGSLDQIEQLEQELLHTKNTSTWRQIASGNII